MRNTSAFFFCLCGRAARKSSHSGFPGHIDISECTFFALLIYQLPSGENFPLLCRSFQAHATFSHVKSKCLQNYCKICSSIMDGLHISMQNSEVYKLHSFSAQVYSFHPCCQFPQKIKSNICMFLSVISAICIFLFVRPFAIIIVYNGGMCRTPVPCRCFLVLGGEQK